MVDTAIDESKKLCFEMKISMERRVSKKKQMDGEGLTNGYPGKLLMEAEMTSDDVKRLTKRLTEVLPRYLTLKA